MQLRQSSVESAEATWRRQKAGAAMTIDFKPSHSEFWLIRHPSQSKASIHLDSLNILAINHELRIVGEIKIPRDGKLTRVVKYLDNRSVIFKGYCDG